MGREGGWPTTWSRTHPEMIQKTMFDKMSNYKHFHHSFSINPWPYPVFIKWTFLIFILPYLNHFSALLTQSESISIFWQKDPIFGGDFHTRGNLDETFCQNIQSYQTSNTFLIQAMRFFLSTGRSFKEWRTAKPSRSSRTSSTGWFLFISLGGSTCPLERGNSKASLVKSLKCWKNSPTPGVQLLRIVQIFVDIRPDMTACTRLSIFTISIQRFLYARSFCWFLYENINIVEFQCLKTISILSFEVQFTVKKKKKKKFSYIYI